MMFMHKTKTQHVKVNSTFLIVSIIMINQIPMGVSVKCSMTGKVTTIGQQHLHFVKKINLM